MEFSKILVRATNWIGDAVMSLPALQALRRRYPHAEISVLARPWVAGLYAREPIADRVIPYNVQPGVRGLAGDWRVARELRRQRFDAAILFQNAFRAALIVWLAGIPRRIGYNQDGRGFLLTGAIPAPRPGEVEEHESYYYLEMLRRAGILEAVPEVRAIQFDGAASARQAGRGLLAEAGLGDKVIGLSPGAAFGSAKRWFPGRFAEAAARVAGERGAAVALFGSAGERPLCDEVEAGLAAAGIRTRNFAGRTSLREFIDMTAACRLFISNDSGAMHVAAAVGVPVVAVFGPTDHVATSPKGPAFRIVREPVDCAPCMLRECPIDHRCMKRVGAERVAEAALELLK